MVSPVAGYPGTPLPNKLGIMVREVALPTGLVDNKVGAISEVWSGLRVVHRREYRR